jgi:serine protease Do
MTKHGLVLLGYLLVNFSVANSAFAAPADALLRELDHSVLRVEVVHADGQHGLGSAVVVAKDEVVTNCHVVNDASNVTVIHNGEAHIATAIKPDWRHDLCMLKVEGLNAPIVRIGATENLKHETSVFTVGYPDKTTAPVNTFGVVKGMFPMDGSVVIRATSSFRLGASGGGVFDEAGSLVGIITLKSKGEQAYYYYMPVAWVQALMSQPTQALGAKSEKPFWASAQKPYFMRVALPHLNKDWKALRTIAQQWTLAEPNNAESWFYLAAAELGVKDYGNAQAHFQRVLLLNKNHLEAEDYLSRIPQQMVKLSITPEHLASLDK